MQLVKVAVHTVVAFLSVLPARADLLWGANGHPLTAYPGVTIQSQLDYLKDLGMRSYRVNISSTAQAPRLAELIREGKARGIDILPVITPEGADLEKDSAQALYAKSRNLAVALVTQFKSDVRVWELGNELESYAILKPCEMQDDGVQYNCAWGPAGGVTDLEYHGPRWAKVSAVLKGLSDGVVSVDPTIRKAIGTAGWGHTGAFARMGQDGIQWDISVWHMYGEDPEWALKILAKFDRPIWITEFNAPHGSRSGERQQAESLQKTMARLRQLQAAYNVEAAHVYEIMDEPYWAPSSESVMGLVRLTREGAGGWQPAGPKAAYHAVKQAIRGDDPIPAIRRSCDLNAYGRVDLARPTQLSYAYCLVVGRPVDGGGLRGWMASLREGMTIQDMLVRMLDSDELKHKYALFGLSSPQFVTLMYQLLLGRDPDQGGLDGYVAQLEDGSATHADINRSIIGSGEFRSRHPILFSSAAVPER